MLEPFAAEVHANLLSARGALLSFNVHVMAEAVDARVSYRDVMLIKVGLPFVFAVFTPAPTIPPPPPLK